MALSRVSQRLRVLLVVLGSECEDAVGRVVKLRGLNLGEAGASVSLTLNRFPVFYGRTFIRLLAHNAACLDHAFDPCAVIV